jgi:hypothetical protein
MPRRENPAAFASRAPMAQTESLSAALQPHLEPDR